LLQGEIEQDEREGPTETCATLSLLFFPSASLGRIIKRGRKRHRGRLPSSLLNNKEALKRQFSTAVSRALGRHFELYEEDRKQYCLADSRWCCVRCCC